ncbi:MAG: hypothetical protein ABIR37_03170 [Candidatus Saccharimonadales bacterium]
MKRLSRKVIGSTARGRVLRVGLVVLIVASVAIPVVQEVFAQRRYKLDAATLALVGPTNRNLTNKFSYDGSKSQWQFNKDGIVPAGQDNPLEALRNQTGGGGKKDKSLYSVDLPTDGQKGITYYDNDTQLSFTLEPTFKVGKGAERDGRLIYTFQDGGKLVYTAKNNGMKEDIILPHDMGDSLQFSYKLNLPETMQAKILEDGSVGIYSADPALFGNISFGTDTDKAKVESARKTATKDHLLFALPAPVIKQTGDGNMSASAAFTLDGDTLHVKAHGLSKLTYPVAVDPSVIITSSSDFTKGNNEGNIDFGSNQLNRGGLTGGTFPNWTLANNFTNARYDHASVVYNGYMYVLGGFGATYYNDVQYASVSGSTVGTWASTTSFSNSRAGLTAVVYNGYMYVLGGYNGATQYNDVQYAPINANGTVGTWASTTSFTTVRDSHGSVAYNGYLYVGGGYGPSAELNDVQYAPINANGTVGTWTSTTAFTNTRYQLGMVAYNGFLYVLGGQHISTYYSDVLYAPINANGTVGTWTATSSMVNTLSDMGTTVYDGYLYVMGGRNAGGYAEGQYAPIYANGSVGTWSNDTGFFSSARYSNAALAYNGYVYSTGGQGSGNLSDVTYAQIKSAGATGTYNTTTALATARRSVVSVAYNGYLYAIGGNTNETTGQLTTVSYATINSAGTIGAWANSTAFTTKRAYFYAAAYNGYMYVVGGRTGSSTVTNSVYYSAIASNGTVGAWTATTSFINGRQQFGGAIYNGYMYIGGGDNAGGTQYSDIQYAAINTAGTLGAWHYTHNSTDDSTTYVSGFTTAREGLTITAAAGYLYVMGGWNAGGAGTYYNDVQYAALNADGTVGTWATTTSFTTTRQGHNAVFANGYLYIAGGSNASYQGDVQYAPVNTNGTVGTWVANTNLSGPTNSTRANFGMAYYAGFMYVVGGFDSTSAYLSEVRYAQVNNGGSGTVGAWTTSGNNFATARKSTRTTVYNGYLYIAGGENSIGGAITDVQYTLIGSDGSIGAWTTDSHTFTTSRQSHGLVAYNGYLYVIGGDCGGGCYYKDVQYAPIGSSGALTANFAATTDIHATVGRTDFGAFAYNGYMYVVGGWDGTIDHDDTRYAAINSNGTLGTWADAGSNFTNARGDMGWAVNNGYLYIAGGNGAATYNDVQYAAINSNGTLGTWKMANGFNGIHQYPILYAANGYLYLASGSTTGSDYLADVQYASINANGTISSWRHSTPLAIAVNEAAGLIYNGFLYAVGGRETGGSVTAKTRYAPLSIIARKGQYSKLIDFGGEYALSTIAYNGSIPGGLANISVKTASSTGTLGSAALASGLSTVAACTAGTNRYAWMLVTLDDTTMAAFPDSVSYANATDITVNYVVKHPDPNVRLRGGKYFAQELLQPLDSCGP